jgi:hypothetical protein
MMRVSPFKRNMVLVFISMFVLLLASQAKASSAPAMMTSPADGSIFTSTNVNFQWEDVGASAYHIWIGRSIGGKELYSASLGTNTSKTIRGLPSNGSTLYVRIFTKISDKWFYNNYTYTTVTADVAAARMTSPTNDSTFTSTTVNFQWENVGAPAYHIWIGTSIGGYELYNASLGTNTSKTINGFSSNGSNVYVRIFTKISDKWFSNDYTYTTATLSGNSARMTSPTNDSTFTSTTVNFQWENVGAPAYYMWIGRSIGGKEMYNASQGTNTSKTFINFPNNGSNVYVRIFTKISDRWFYHDYTYTTVTRSVNSARMTSPTNDSTFTSTTVNFQWENVGAPAYHIWIGTSIGGYELYNASLGTNTSKTINGFSSNGSNVYVRMWTKISDRWFSHDYTYTTVTTSAADRDSDGILDPVDNCPDIANPGQGDVNSNDTGDHCECSFTTELIDLGPWQAAQFLPIGGDPDGVACQTDSVDNNRTITARNSDADSDALLLYFLEYNPYSERPIGTAQSDSEMSSCAVFINCSGF